MKGSGWFLKPPPSSFVPFTFPFLSQLSVCLCVSRVRAYLTTNQQYPYYSAVSKLLTSALNAFYWAVKIDSDGSYIML